LGRVINYESAGKKRKYLCRCIVLAIRELSYQNEVDNNTKDLTAFIALSLFEISSTVDKTVEPWEKRGYWVKADRFRLDWSWTNTYSIAMFDALLDENWAEVISTLAKISNKLSAITVPQNHRLGSPWIDSWKKLENMEKFYKK